MIMKKLIILFLLWASPLWAGMTCMIVEKVDASRDNAAYWKASVYGLKDDGEAKAVEIKGALDIAKVDAINNCACFKLTRTPGRFIIYFNGDGTPDRCEHHQIKPHEPSICRDFDAEAKAAIAGLKTLIESK